MTLNSFYYIIVFIYNKNNAHPYKMYGAHTFSIGTNATFFDRTSPYWRKSYWEGKVIGKEKLLGRKSYWEGKEKKIGKLLGRKSYWEGKEESEVTGKEWCYWEGEVIGKEKKSVKLLGRKSYWEGKEDSEVIGKEKKRVKLGRKRREWSYREGKEESEVIWEGKYRKMRRHEMRTKTWE
jgi:hypothetical protein